MKTKFKYLFIIGLSIFIMPLFACGGKPKLASPVNLSIDEMSYIISWKEVAGAGYYIVDINGKTYQTTMPSFPAEEIVNSSGEYLISVSALDFKGNYLQSDFCDEIKFDNKQKLDAPVIQIKENVLSWEPVENAEYYTVCVNGVKFVSTSTSFDLAEQNEISNAINFGEDNTFYVYCTQTSNYLKSDASNIITKFMAGFLPAPTNLNVVKNNNVITLSFDAVLNAEVYTLVVNDIEYQITETTSNITDKINGFGKFNIAVKCNDVVIDDEVKYLCSKYAEIQFENKPAFVDERVENIKVENNILTFNAVEDAEFYEVLIDNQSHLTVQPVLNLTSVALEAGYHSIKVYAKNGDYSTLESETCSHLITEILAKPTIEIETLNERIMLTISAVKNATSYGVLVNSSYEVYGSNNLEIDITSLLQSGANEISVTALGDGVIFTNSAPANYDYNYEVV